MTVEPLQTAEDGVAYGLTFTAAIKEEVLRPREAHHHDSIPTFIQMLLGDPRGWETSACEACFNALLASYVHPHPFPPRPSVSWTLSLRPDGVSAHRCWALVQAICSG